MGCGNEITVMSQHLASVPGCEYLPNERAVETIRQLFTWLLICCTLHIHLSKTSVVGTWLQINYCKN
jgi:hypothetical protein